VANQVRDAGRSRVRLLATGVGAVVVLVIPLVVLWVTWGQVLTPSEPERTSRTATTQRDRNASSTPVVPRRRDGDSAVPERGKPAKSRPNKSRRSLQPATPARER
jgi:hypothetical protein